MVSRKVGRFQCVDRVNTNLAPTFSQAAMVCETGMAGSISSVGAFSSTDGVAPADASSAFG